MDKIDIFPWNDNFNTGLTIVDEQHQKLVDIINRLAAKFSFDPKSIDLSTIFDELLAYTKYHFDTEEAIWESHLDEKSILAHKDTHNNFIDNVKIFIEKQQNNSIEVTSENILNFLVRWLVTHILESDRHLAYRVAAIESGYSVDESIHIATEEMSGHTREMIDIIIQIYDSFSHTTLHLMRELETRQDIEKKINHQDRYRDLLLELSTEFINLPLDEIDDNINKSLEKMANFVGADRAYICDYDFNAQTTSNTYEWCAEDITAQIDELQNIPLDFIPEWPAAHTKGEYLLIQDVGALEEGHLRDILSPQEIQSLVTVPLFENAQCSGFVGFDTVKVKHHFSPSEISILELFSKLLSNIAERQHKESELSRERNSLKTLFQAIPDLVWIKDIDGVYLSCNSRFEDFFGAKEGDIVGKTDYDFVDKPLADLFRLNDKKVMQSSHAHINEEKVPFANDGHEEILHTTKVPMYDEEGKLSGVMGVGRDITFLKETQKELVRKEYYQRALLDNFPFMVWLKDDKNRFITLNKPMANACRFTDTEDLVGKTDYDIWPKELADLYSKDDKEVLHSGKPKTVEEPIETLEGRIWAETYKSPVTIDGEVIGTVGFSRDITEKKLLEQQIEKSEKSLRDIFDNAQSGLMFISGERFLIKANQRAADIFGYTSPEEMIGLSMRNFHLSEEKYLEYGKMNFDALRMGVKLNIEYEARRKDDSGIWCEISGKALDHTIPADMSKGVLWTVNDISERVALKKTQTLLQERLTYAIEGSNDGLWDWNIQTNEIYYSPRWKEILGYEDDELKNEFIEWENRVHPDDLKFALIEFDRFLESTDLNDHFTNKFRMKHKDGQYVHILSRAKKVFDDNNKVERLVGTHVDMTELYTVQEAYKQERDRSKLYLDTAEVLLVALDINGRVTMLNRKGEELLGYKEEELLGKAWFEVGVLPKDVGIKVKSFFGELLQMDEAPKEEYQHHLISKSGEKLMFSFYNSLLFDNEKKCIGLLSSAMDITELKQKDEMLINQSRHAAMGEMIGMIAHQWRQPISIISMEANNMLLDIALDDFDTTAAEEYGKNIIDHTQHLSKTIDDFRNFFKPDKAVVKVNIRDTIDQTLSIVKDSLRNNTIELKSTFETETEVDAYPRELMQVFVNIITNAKDALVHNEIKDGQIAIRVYEDERYLNTEICDNGGGIDAVVLPKVFDPYFSTKDEKNGIGLGLYMSKMIIEDHLNGIIEAHNNDDGACFTVRLLKKSEEE